MSRQAGSHRHGCHIHQCRVITWPAVTCLPSHCQHNLLQSNKGLGIIPGAGCTSQTMSSHPAINIDVITLSTCCVRLVAQSRNPSLPRVLRFIHPGGPVFVVFVDCLNFLLLTFPWLISKAVFYPECSVNSHVRSLVWKRAAQTYCLHKHSKPAS